MTFNFTTIFVDNFGSFLGLSHYELNFLTKMAAANLKHIAQSTKQAWHSVFPFSLSAKRKKEKERKACLIA